MNSRIGGKPKFANEEDGAAARRTTDSSGSLSLLAGPMVSCTRPSLTANVSAADQRAVPTMPRWIVEF